MGYVRRTTVCNDSYIRSEQFYPLCKAIVSLQNCAGTYPSIRDSMPYIKTNGGKTGMIQTGGKWGGGAFGKSSESFPFEMRSASVSAVRFIVISRLQTRSLLFVLRQISAYMHKERVS